MPTLSFTTSMVILMNIMLIYLQSSCYCTSSTNNTNGISCTNLGSYSNRVSYPLPCCNSPTFFPPQHNPNHVHQQHQQLRALHTHQPTQNCFVSSRRSSSSYSGGSVRGGPVLGMRVSAASASSAATAAAAGDKLQAVQVTAGANTKEGIAEESPDRLAEEDLVNLFIDIRKVRNTNIG